MKKSIIVSLSILSFVLISCGNTEVTKVSSPEIPSNQSPENTNSGTKETGFGPNTPNPNLAEIGTVSEGNGNIESKGTSESNGIGTNINELSLIDFTNSKIDGKSLSEYKQMLIELSYKTGSGRTNLYGRSIGDTKILNKYSELLLKLFNEGLLPTLKTFKIDNKEYFVTAGFVPGSGDSPKKEDYLNGKANCGAVSVPGGEYNGSCILINKENNIIYIDSNIWLKDWSGEPAFEVVQGKYLLSNRSDGDSCGSSSSYSLFDSDLKSISGMDISYNGCEGMETTFSKGDSAISFYNTPQSDEDIINNKKEKLFEGGNFSSLTFLKTLTTGENFGGQYTNSFYYLYNSDSKFKLDVVKNLLNGNKFSFTINNKNIDFDPADESTWYTTDKYSLVLSMKKISEGFEISGSNQLGIDSIGIKSCKDNGSEYDSNIFSPKSLDKDKGTFTYRISKKFGNLCNTPYEFNFKVKNDEKLYSKKVEIVFP